MTSPAELFSAASSAWQEVEELGQRYAEALDRYNQLVAQINSLRPDVPDGEVRSETEAFEGR